MTFRSTAAAKVNRLSEAIFQRKSSVKTHFVAHFLFQNSYVKSAHFFGFLLILAKNLSKKLIFNFVSKLLQIIDNQFFTKNARLCVVFFYKQTVHLFQKWPFVCYGRFAQAQLSNFLHGNPYFKWHLFTDLNKPFPKNFSKSCRPSRFS